MRNAKIVTITMLIAIGLTTFLTIQVSDTAASLNKFHSYEELKEFLQTSTVQYHYPQYPEYFMNSGSRAALQNTLDLSSFSQTNVQVEGVDEADIVKTDGEYIYVISGQTLFIVKAYPAEEAAVLSKIAIAGTLEQMFINGDRLVVFYENGSWSEAKTFIHIYDVSNKESPILKREESIDGHYFSSRMIGEYVYVVVNKQAYLDNGEVRLPEIYSNSEYKGINAADVYYSNIACSQYVFTTVLALNVQEDAQEPVYAPFLLGETATLYVSLENIYLAIYNGYETTIHRIHIENDTIEYLADGEVPGIVLNQFSMDEYEGYFRIATTSPIDWFTRVDAILQEENNIYVLDMDLDIVGKLENIASGEKIHSARFMGNVGYLVTFKKTDPLFVISLSDPYSPTILGELKIPGYSDYLHPYDENHLIGIGKETIEAEEGNFAWYQGVKISLFDVTELSEPKQLAKYEIGDRGTDSPILSDHKAFLFDKEKSLMVIPVTVARIDSNQYSGTVPPYAYGETVWQGAYVFTISLELEEKMTLRGTITHIEDGDVYNTSNYITRTLYIGNVLYTVSNNRIKMNLLSDLSEIATLELDV